MKVWIVVEDNHGNGEVICGIWSSKRAAMRHARRVARGRRVKYKRNPHLELVGERCVYLLTKGCTTIFDSYIKVDEHEVR